MGFVKGGLFREKRIAEWSEGRAEDMSESRKSLLDVRVMIQSRVWPRWCVGCVTGLEFNFFVWVPVGTLDINFECPTLKLSANNTLNLRYAFFINGKSVSYI